MGLICRVEGGGNPKYTKNERMKKRKRAREQEGERERKRRTKGQPSVKDFLSVTWCETSGPVYRAAIWRL